MYPKALSTTTGLTGRLIPWGGFGGALVRVGPGGTARQNLLWNSAVKEYIRLTSLYHAGINMVKYVSYPQVPDLPRGAAKHLGGLLNR